MPTKDKGKGKEVPKAEVSKVPEIVVTRSISADDGPPRVGESIGDYISRNPYHLRQASLCAKQNLVAHGEQMPVLANTSLGEIEPAKVPLTNLESYEAAYAFRQRLEADIRVMRATITFLDEQLNQLAKLPADYTGPAHGDFDPAPTEYSEESKSSDESEGDGEGSEEGEGDSESGKE